MHSVGRIPRYPMRRCDGTDVKTAETALQGAVVQGVTALRLKMAGQTKSPHWAGGKENRLWKKGFGLAAMEKL